MDMNVKDLFSKGKSNNLGKLQGKWKVKKQGSSIYVELYEQGLVQFNGDSPSKTIQFDFDLKFAFVKDPVQVKFERGKDTCAYVLPS